MTSIASPSMWMQFFGCLLSFVKLIEKGPEPCVTLPARLKYLSIPRLSSFLKQTNSSLPSSQVGLLNSGFSLGLMAILSVLNTFCTPAIQLVQLRQTRPWQPFLNFTSDVPLRASSIRIPLADPFTEDFIVSSSILSPSLSSDSENSEIVSSILSEARNRQHNPTQAYMTRLRTLLRVRFFSV